MMLSDEEKEGIEYLKARLYGNESCKFIDVAQSDLRILLNLIEKQSKEIEENKKYLVNLTHEQYIKLVEQIRNEINKEWKDVIKAKIEDLESQIDDIKSNFDYEYDEDMANEVWRLENKIDVLQSLLEKE